MKWTIAPGEATEFYPGVFDQHRLPPCLRVLKIRSIGDQSTAMGKIRNAIYSGHLKFFRESNDFITVSRREAVRWDNNAAVRFLGEANQRRLDFTRSFHAHFYRIDPCRRSSTIQGAHITSPARVVSAHQNADSCQMRCDLLEELDPLSRDPEIEKMGVRSQ